MHLYKHWQILFFLFIFLTAAHLGQAQTLFYDIYKGKDKIGEILVKKVKKGNTVHYQANSKSSFRVLFMNELETRQAADFVDNELVACRSKNTLNGKIRTHTEMKKEGDTYHIFKHPDERYQKKLPHPIHNSTVLLYFTEPLNITNVYSENYLEDCPITPLGNNTYELELPGGKINHYVYKNGELVEIKIFRTFVDLSFRLRQQG